MREEKITGISRKYARKREKERGRERRERERERQSADILSGIPGVRLVPAYLSAPRARAG